MDTMDTGTQNSGRQNKLVVDLKSVIRDAEELLKSTGQQVGEGYQSARAKFETSLRAAKEEMCKVEEAVSAKKDEAIDATDNYVHAHPWQSVGVGVIAGLLLGLLAGRK